MATRLYLPSTGTPSISPAFNGTVYDDTANADRRSMVTTRINSAMTDKSGADVLTSGNDELLRQYIYGPLAAQTISGTFKGQVRARCATTNGARALTLRLCKVSADGGTVTEVLALFTSPDAGGASPPSYTTTTTNRRFEQGPFSDDFVVEFSDITISTGEFLMLEFGNHSDSSGNPRTGTLSFGDDSGTDLPEDETETSAFNPWVEFSDDIVLLTGDPVTAFQPDAFQSDAFQIGGITPAGSTYTITAESGTVTITGTAATLRYGHRIIAESGTYTITGTAATLRYGHRIIAASGSFTITGTAALLVNPTIYYVSPTGDDGDDGQTPGTAWATLSKVNGETYNPGDSILFERDGVWIGELRSSSDGTANWPITYGAYDSGAKPIISPSSPISSGAWSKTGGLTNVYQASVSGGDIDAVWGSSWFAVWDQSFRWTAKAASAAACDATPGTAFYDTAADILYVHTHASSDPATDGPYWVTLYQIGISSHGFDYNEFEDFTSLFASAHCLFTADADSGIPWTVSTGSGFRRCSAVGSVHNCVTLLGEDLFADECDVSYYRNDGGYVLADARVADPSNPATDGVTLTDCVASTNPAWGGKSSQAFKAEGEPSNLTLIDCSITGACDIGWYSYTGATVAGVLIQGLSIPGAIGIAVSDHDSTDFVVEGLVMGTAATSYAVICDETTGLVVRESTLLSALAAITLGDTPDAAVYRNVLIGTSYGILLSAGGSHAITNNTISSPGYGIVWSDATLITSDTVRNNIVVHAQSVLVLNSSTTIVENYNLAFDVDWWANDSLSLAAYQGATGDGANSLIADPLFINEGGGDYRLSPTSPAVNAGTIVSPITDGYIGSAPDIGAFELVYEIEADAGSVVITGTAATLRVGHRLLADSGAFTITGTNATLRVAFKLTASSGAFTITGTDATLRRGYSMAAGAGTVTITGTNATLRVAFKLAANAGAFTITGTNATLRVGHRLIAESGSFAITGTAATLRIGYRIAANSGSFAITGTAATLRYGHVVTATSGTVAITGTDVTFRRGYVLSAGSGTVVITGTDAALSTASNKTLVAEAGTVTITGTAATLRATFRLTAESGSFTITGTAATLRAARQLAANSGSFTITGTAASLTASRRLLADAGVYTITGTNAALTTTRRLVADAGTVLLTGTAASLYAGRRVAANAGTVIITGTATAFSYVRRLSAGSGSVVITGTDALLTYTSLDTVSTLMFVNIRVTPAAASFLSVGASPAHDFDGLTIEQVSAGWSGLDIRVQEE